MLTVFKERVTPDQVREVIAAFDEGVVAHTGEDIASADEARLVEQVPALRTAVLPLTAGDESPAAVAAAVEFVLEGLHLSKRLNKDASGNRATYRGRIKKKGLFFFDPPRVNPLMNASPRCVGESSVGRRLNP